MVEVTRIHNLLSWFCLFEPGLAVAQAHLKLTSNPPTLVKKKKSQSRMETTDWYGTAHMKKHEGCNSTSPCEVFLLLLSFAGDSGLYPLETRSLYAGA